MDRLVLPLVVGLACFPVFALPAKTLPDDALIEQGATKLDAGDVDGALAAFAQAARVAPKDPRARYLRGAALAKQDPVAAIAAYREALALDGTLAAVHAELGALLLDNARRDEAATELLAALKFDPSLGAAWVNLAKLEAGRGRSDAAIAAYREAAQRMPGDADVRIDLSMELRKAGKVDEAIKAAREAISLDAANAPAQLALGFALKSAGKHDDAAVAFTTATKLDPKSAVALWALGQAEHERKHDDAALAALTHAYALDPKPPIAVDLASVQAAKGQTTKALDTLRAALAKSPRSLGLHVELAKMLATAGKCAEAKKALAELPEKQVEAAAAAIKMTCDTKAK